MGYVLTICQPTHTTATRATRTATKVDNEPFSRNLLSWIHNNGFKTMHASGIYVVHSPQGFSIFIPKNEKFTLLPLSQTQVSLPPFGLFTLPLAIIARNRYVWLCKRVDFRDFAPTTKTQPSASSLSGRATLRHMPVLRSVILCSTIRVDHRGILEICE